MYCRSKYNLYQQIGQTYWLQSGDSVSRPLRAVYKLSVGHTPVKLHCIARRSQGTVLRKIRLTLNWRPLNTEIFSKRRKIYSICSEDLRWWLQQLCVGAMDRKPEETHSGVVNHAATLWWNLIKKWGASRSWRYCNARPTRDEDGASSGTSTPFKDQFNIEGDTWSPYQILSW